ncbi:MAG: helix-hairpin-helix domain-containing protein, partial [Ignavibacteriales bacterium]|nr:helix-hairpin-helix domain-containing protein [Ignavibacteriales bacterium]
MRLFFSVSLIVGFWGVTKGQEPEIPDTVETRVEDIEGVLEDITQDGTDSQLADVLARLEESPLDLNSATDSELQQIPGVTPTLAFRIVASREKQRFTSVRDLLRIEGFTEELYLRVAKYVVVVNIAERGTPAVFRMSFRSRTQTDLQQRAGFANGAYAGSPVKSYNRMIAAYAEGGDIAKTSQHSLELGMLMEKDPGERSVNDFIAGYALFNAPSFSVRVLLGDFVIEAGEGLVLWRSVGFSKGSEVISPLQKRGYGLKPYLSTDENLFFRGAAAEWKLNSMSVTVFHSSKPITASINADGNITSLFSDGYHRTSGELARKNNSHERLSGFKVALEPLWGVKVGGTAYRAQFDKGLFLSEASGYPGNNVSAGGFDITYTNRFVSIFSEIAKAGAGSPAGIAGLVFAPDKRIDLAVSARFYPKDFSNVHAFGFRESGSLTQNESGLYVGAQAIISRFLKISTYYDQFQFPWRTSSLEVPAAGNDFLCLGDVRVTRNLNAQILYKNRHKPSSQTELDIFQRSKDVMSDRNQKNYRLTVRFTSSAKAEWKSRFEMVDVVYSPTQEPQRG